MDMKMELKQCGEDVIIYPQAKLVKLEAIEIGDHSMIDDFSFINGGEGVKIGRYVHIASFVSIIGGGVLEVGDYADVAAGARILTATDTYHEGARMSTALPEEQRNVKRSFVRICKDAFVGTNSVVHPGVTIGEGAVVGSCSLVLADCEPWIVYAGVPCRPIGRRPKVTRPDL